MAAVRAFTKYAGRTTCARDIAPALTAAVKAAVTGRPGAAYVDLPSDVLMAAVPPGELPAAGSEGWDRAGFPAVAERQHADADAVAEAAALLRGAQRCAGPSGVRACGPHANTAGGRSWAVTLRRTCAGQPVCHVPKGLCNEQAAAGGGQRRGVCARGRRTARAGGRDRASLPGYRHGPRRRAGQPPGQRAGRALCRTPGR